jgi:hypothetical protein
MDLDMGPLVASLIVSSVGLGLFMYGKREVRTTQYAFGLVLMVAPYFTDTVTSTLGVGGLLVGGMLATLRWAL